MNFEVRRIHPERPERCARSRQRCYFCRISKGNHIQLWCLFNVWKPDGLFSHSSRLPDCEECYCKDQECPPPVKAWRALSTCNILHFVFCQGIITTQEPPFHSVQCTLIVDFLWRNKNMHSSQRATHFHKIVPQQW